MLDKAKGKINRLVKEGKDVYYEEKKDEMVPKYGDISDTWSKKTYERFFGEVTLEFD